VLLLTVKIAFSLIEKSIFLWCGEQGAQWRGWLPWSGFVQQFLIK